MVTLFNCMIKLSRMVKKKEFVKEAPKTLQNLPKFIKQTKKKEEPNEEEEESLLNKIMKSDMD